MQRVELVAGVPTVTNIGAGNCPTFSVDDKRIAFMLGHAVEDAAPGVWLMQADGKGRRRLGDVGRPKWSPDGKQLMLIDASYPPEVTLMDVKSEKSARLELAGSRFYSTPSWAGSDTIVALIGTNGDGDRLALIDVSEPSKAKVKEVLWEVKEPINDVVDPVYSPSRRECVFIGVTKDGMALYSVAQSKPDAPKRLEPDAFDPMIWDLAFSPDGRYVLFGSTRADRKGR